MMPPTPGRSADLYVTAATAVQGSTATTAPCPVPAASQTGDSLGVGGWIALVLPASVVAALITGLISIWLARRKSREEERARIRNTFAEAFQAYADYKEFPYAVRRRDAEQPSEERLRLSEALREVQSRLSYYESWTALESPAVGAAYTEMIKQLRRVAGEAIREAWGTPGLTDDVDMNIPSALVDLSSLPPYEQAYRDAVAAHLRHLAPRWS